MSATRIITALVYAVTTGIGLWQTTQPTTVEAWIGIVLAALVAGWGKFSSPTTMIASDHAQVTPVNKL